MREPIVTCQFVGRLGNQLWQLGATVNYALTHNMKALFPNRSLNENLWPLHFKSLPRIDGRFIKPWKQPDDGGYYEIPYYPRGVALHGFFQSYKYINHPGTLDRMKKLIGYKDEEPRPGVAIHVRRGDYLKHKDAFPPLPVHSYYHQAVSALTEPMPIHVFSDDIESAKKEIVWHGVRLVNPGEESKYIFHETGDPVSDLFEMSRYEHQIIANSSYSYWAAMLNPNPNKIVICPHHKQYYGPDNAHLKTVDLYPPEWKEVRF